MLTCEDVAAALPLIEAGEAVDGEVRDHLASCPACRGEAGRLRADREALRRDLAVLAPSPFLEDAVMESARGSGGGTRWRHPHALWLGTGLGLMAASLVVAFLLAARSGGPHPTAGGDGEEAGAEDAAATRIRMPPSAATIVAARRANPPNFDDPPGVRPRPMWRHWYWNAQGGIDMLTLDAIQPLDWAVTHRWVHQTGVGETGPRAHALVGVPPRGVQVLGKALIDRVGGIGLLQDKEFVGGGAVSIEVVVGSPGERGTRARVEALLRPDYTGSLLLEEPLARALGLYQFEIPGRCTIAGDLSVPAVRARARVRLQPSRLDPGTKRRVELPPFDEVVEVQVLPAGRPHPAPALSIQRAGGLSLRFEGERPGRVLSAAQVEALPSPGPDPRGLAVRARGGVRVTELAVAGKRIVEVPLGKPGPQHVVLSYAEGRRPACSVWLPPLDAGGDGPAGYVLELVRTELAQRYEPGAHVVISRVWRGGTAIPSRESVAYTTVAADGAVSFVRLRGEEGASLRMRVEGADGKARYHEIRVPRRQIVINVTADGQVHCRQYSYAFFRPGGSGGTAGPEPGALEALRDQLAKLVRAHRSAGSGSRPDPGVLVNAQAAVPWRVITWILQTCAAPDVALRHVRYKVVERDDVALRNDLPVDSGLSPPGAPRVVERVRVVLRPTEEGTRLTARWGTTRIEGVMAGASPVLDDLREHVHRRVRAERAAGLEVVIVAPPPHGGNVPYGDVHRVLRALRAAGAGQVLLEGYAVPR